jgi:hypothetical protein
MLAANRCNQQRPIRARSVPRCPSVQDSHHASGHQLSYRLSARQVPGTVSVHQLQALPRGARQDHRQHGGQSRQHTARRLGQGSPAPADFQITPFDAGQMRVCMFPQAHAWGVYLIGGDRMTCPGSHAQKRKVVDILNQRFYLLDKCYRIVPFAAQQPNWVPFDKSYVRLRAEFAAG